MADLPHSDYRGHLLAVGDTVAFIDKGMLGVQLSTGRVALLHGNQLCIEARTLTTLDGVTRGRDTAYAGGKSLQEDHVLHATVVRIESTDAAGATE